MSESKNSSNEHPPSKSQRKREMTALQKLGEQLVALSATELEKISLDSKLLTAITTARELKSHEAKRRQLQYIGRLMRDVDPKPIEEAISKIKFKHHQLDAIFHQTERWRDKLIAEGDVQLQELLTQFPDGDRQHLRQLIRQAQQGKQGADRELFRYLRQIIEKKN